MLRDPGEEGERSLPPRFCSLIGQIVVNEPLAGSYIPLRHFGHDNRVASVMAELRRDMYLLDDGSPDPLGAIRISAALAVIPGTGTCSGRLAPMVHTRNAMLGKDGRYNASIGVPILKGHAFVFAPYRDVRHHSPAE